MLTLYRGTRIERLSARLALLMKEDPIGNPFIPEVIGVQNHGMARWLSMELARSLQIAGNLDFQFPAEVVWRIYRSVDDSIPDQLPSDREPMKWTIYSVLRDLTDQEPFGFLPRYTRPEGGSFNAKKGRELADTVADLFDEYIVYRPDMITKWEEGDLVSGDPSEEWQMQLWNRLKERWSGAHEGFELEDRVAIHRRCMEALRNGEMELDRLPDRLTLFGITTMPASFVELFVELSGLIDIHWFWMDPVDETLQEDLKKVAGEPGFLSVYAAEGIEFYTMLEQAVRQLEAEIDIVEVEDAPDESNTFLGAVRDRIVHPADGAADEGMEDAELQKDGSFRIHSCHSAVREVEVLHDQILGMLEEDPGLHTDEILVMVPELNDYAAAIDSVFGAGEKELPDIPYHIIHDMPLKRDPVFIGLSKLLRLLESRFKVTDVFDLLWMEPVRKAYDIGVDQLNTLQRWVQQTRIRWGLDARDKLRSDLPPTDQNTFASGLNQLLLGFAAHADEELYKGIYPYDEIETFDDADLLGRFASFVEDLREARDQVIDSYTPGEWGQILKRWVNTFFAGDERFMQSAGRIHDLLDDAVQSMIFGGWNEDLPFAAWTDELESSLEKAQTGGGYFGQGVTFCGLNPMRNIPHKVIAFLGMNSGAFPHSDIISEFDLIRKNPRPGDRIKRKD
ncbi:MAG: exodeoxyribonuclease V subunit gamma, partial [Balneolaceae bacterium]|nr:exodeoxyribonuclease V subunit gamma [Balneolaceae bacterium]